MDRQIVYPGQILPETTLLQMAKDAMIGSAKLAAAMLGTSTIANGFAVTPTGPASLQIVVAPGEIYAMANIDSLAFSTLPADTTHSIMKQGIMLDGVTLSCPAPTTTGQSINYLVQVTYQDQDSTPVLLPYYNSANPALPYGGMGNNGMTQNTSRKGSVVVSLKAGAPAVTGSQTTPAPDSGYVGVRVVTVAYGQTTITSASISQYSGAPILPTGVIQSVQTGNTSFAIDSGSANAYTCNFSPAITGRSEGQVLRFKVNVSNTGASTFNDGFGAIPLVGAAHTALQGGELFSGGDAWVQFNTNLYGGAYILLFCTGAPEQVAPATQSQHAMQLGQAVGRLLNVRVITATTTYTPTIGTTSVVVKLIGGGGSGGGCSATGVGQASVSSGGSGGGYCLKRIVTGFAGVTITIGAGGTAQAPGAAGVSGGTTSFGALCSATGGSGGLSGVATGTFPSLTGTSQPGAGSNGDVNGSGDWANISMILSSSYLFQSLGESGGSVIGGSVRAQPDDVSASPVANTGAGGSAVGCSASKSPRAGGAGGSGVAIILEYA